MIRKKKQKSLSWFRKKAWGLYSLCIRRRDADENGYGPCISCGVIRHYTQMNAGHYHPQSLGLQVVFVEKNVNSQCPYCNLALQGNQVEYSKALIKKYGPEVLEELEIVKCSSVKFSRSDYEEMIEKYNQRLLVFPT